MTKKDSTEICVDYLLDQVPELRALYDNHVHDNDELLPHVFLGDVTRYVVQHLRSGETGPSTPVARIICSLERCMATDDERVKELVSVSFLENLAEHDDVLVSLAGRIGPNLERELRKHAR